MNFLEITTSRIEYDFTIILYNLNEKYIVHNKF